jgi:hypothetical protein
VIVTQNCLAVWEIKTNAPVDGVMEFNAGTCKKSSYKIFGLITIIITPDYYEF